MAIFVSNDSVNFSIKAPLKESIIFFETLAQKTVDELYDIVINAIGPEAAVHSIGTSLVGNINDPLIHIEYLKPGNHYRFQTYISWKDDHWDVYQEPQFHMPTLLDVSIGRSADGLPTHDC